MKEISRVDMDEVCCSIEEFESQALQILDDDVADYYQGGASSEQTLKNNRKAFTKLRLRPRVMRNVSERDSSLIILGQRHRCPVGISPSAMQKLAHQEGEVATARAAAAMDAIMVLSILSTTSLEDVSKENPKATLWLQVYIFKERNLTLDLIHRAANAGYKAIVLTMDTAVLGSRYRDLKNNFTMPPYLALENFRNINEDLSTFRKNPGECKTELTDYISTQFDDSVSWDDVRWLVSSTQLPVICKGILTGPDALLCYQAGAKGIIVSNHGGRQLDQTPATIEALPEVVQAVGDQIEVYMDGGIRYGTDIFKAVGLGAKYVFIGRAALYGLTHSGTKGVIKVLQILHFEFDQTLALCGCISAKEITPDMIVHKRYYENLLLPSSSQNVPSHRQGKILKNSSRDKSHQLKKKCSLKIHITESQTAENFKNHKKTTKGMNSNYDNKDYEGQEPNKHSARQSTKKYFKAKNYFRFKATPETCKNRSAKSPSKELSHAYIKNSKRQKSAKQNRNSSPTAGTEQKSNNSILVKKKKIPSSSQHQRKNEKPTQKRVTVKAPKHPVSNHSRDSRGSYNSEESTCRHSEQHSNEKFCDSCKESSIEPVQKERLRNRKDHQKQSYTRDEDISKGNYEKTSSRGNETSRGSSKICMNCSSDHPEDFSKKYSSGIKRNLVSSSMNILTNQLPRRLLRKIHNRF